MNPITRAFGALILVGSLAACQGDASTPTGAASIAPSTQPTTIASPSDEASAEPSEAAPSLASASAALPAAPFDPTSLETVLTTVGCDGPNTGFIGMRIWGCPGGDGEYVVQLLTDQSEFVTDVLISPDFESLTPTEEVTDLTGTILEVVAPSATSAELQAVADAIGDFDADADADPTEVAVGGWTAYLAPAEGTHGEGWSLGLHASS